MQESKVRELFDKAYKLRWSCSSFSCCSNDNAPRGHVYDKDVSVTNVTEANGDSRHECWLLSPVLGDGLTSKVARRDT